MRRSRHRQCITLRGSEEETRAAANALVANLAGDAVLWGAHDFSSQLGSAFDAVVLDAHAGLNADALGQAHGLVWGGGALILRRPPSSLEPAAGWLAAFPYEAGDVGRRFERRIDRVLGRVDAPPEPLRAASRSVTGTTEQARAVERLSSAWAGRAATRIAVIADRGRGKSSALGLALARLEPDSKRAAVTASSVEAAREVLRFAGPDVPFVALSELLAAPGAHDIVLVDEAAQIPVPLLRTLALEHPEAHLAFATTTHGYEGTGRGFTLRFLTWLQERGPVDRIELKTPIRWEEGDALEDAVFDALLLNADLAELPASAGVAQLEVVAVDRDELIKNEAMLREFFGLLVHAHYRTTPSDLHRFLDAPNVQLYAALLDGHVVAANVVANEGGLPPELCEQVRIGRTRLRAHALADSIVAHLGHGGAGQLTMLRSVRIAVHPVLRRRGVASRLIEHVHDRHDPDLFGTMFGATPELIAFRRRLGYEVVRLGGSRGARAGEPSVMMVRSNSPRARALVDTLRDELSHELPLQLRLSSADAGIPVEAALSEALSAGLRAPPPRTDAQCRDRALDYATGPRTFESAATSVRRFVEASGDALDGLAAAERAVVTGRVLKLRPWPRVAADAGLASVPAAMRTLRRAIRALL